MAKNVDYYVSSTHGKIPLSLAGRNLLQQLREVVKNSIDASRKIVRLTAEKEEQIWQPVSAARGELARFMSDLEIAAARQEVEIAQLKLQLTQAKDDYRRISDESRSQRSNREYWENAYRQLHDRQRSSILLSEATAKQLVTELAKKVY